MDTFLKALKIIGLIAAVVALGVGLGWLGSRGGARNPKPGAGSSGSPATTSEPSSAAGKNAASPTPKSQPGVTPSPGVASQNPNVKPATATTSTAATNLITDWEERLDQIIGSEGKETDKAKQLLDMFPRLPADGQAEVAQHLCNLTPDEAYAPLGQYLTNSATPESVLDVLMMDLLNRPNSLKLPYLLGIAREDQNPKAGDAKVLLELFLEENYGNDWPKWQAKMEDWLKENPD